MAADSRRMLHIVGDSKGGGCTRIVLQIAAGAQASGWSVDVLTSDPLFTEGLRSAGIRPVSLDVVRRDINPVTDAYATWQLTKLIKRGRYDVVHTHRPKPGVIGRLAARRARTPLIVHTLHGFPLKEDAPFAARAVVAQIERLASSWSHEVVAVSHHHARELVERRMAPRSKVHAVPNGIPDLLLDYDGPSTRETANDRFTVCVMGRLARQKGLEQLIDAVKVIKDRGGPELRVKIVGEGPIEQELQDRARAAGVAACVDFLGYRTDVARILTGSDIIVLPSLREGMSIALLEAMCCARPIVATSIPGNLEATDGGRVAWVVPPGDVRALADAIMAAEKTPRTERERLGRLARSHFLENYLAVRMIDQYLNLYSQACHLG